MQKDFNPSFIYTGGVPGGFSARGYSTYPTSVIYDDINKNSKPGMSCTVQLIVTKANSEQLKPEIKVKNVYSTIATLDNLTEVKE